LILFGLQNISRYSLGLFLFTHQLLFSL